MRNRLSSADYVRGICSGDRGILSRAITLAESRLPKDQEISKEIFKELMPFTGHSVRIAVTGVPGAGKSTLLDILGKKITSANKKVAVLAVDPTSTVTKGSILGDKTRMEQLSRDPLAFIRPSPSAGSIGGIARRTREAMLLCEAAGYEMIFIETVGVGQIETQVHNMVDLFLLVMLTGAGDELQMIKKGIMEMADIIVVNKADGNNKDKALKTCFELEKSVQEFSETVPGWKRKVLSASAIENTGVNDIVESIHEFYTKVLKNGYLKRNREKQNLEWMYEFILELLEESFYNSNAVKSKIKAIEEKVSEGEMSSIYAAEYLFEIFKAGK